MKWLYLAFLALQFILALGNRPKGERAAYTITLWVYAFLAVYLIVCSFALTGKAFANIPNELKGKTTAQVIATFFTPPVGALIAAMISTFGIYFIASFLYVRLLSLSLLMIADKIVQSDPWHMFSSFLQYLCLAMSFTNVLNVYAFCNLHDVSWGTKGSDKVDALPSVSSSKTKDAETVVEDMAKAQVDVDSAFKETVTRAVTKVDVTEVPEKPNMDDQNKTFRTRLVACWMMSNAGLAVAIQNIDGLPTGDEAADNAALQRKQNIYFAIILYSTFGLAVVRFAGVSGLRSKWKCKH